MRVQLHDGRVEREVVHLIEMGYLYFGKVVMTAAGSLFGTLLLRPEGMESFIAGSFGLDMFFFGR